MDELKVKFCGLFVAYSLESHIGTDFNFLNDYWPKIEQLIESERAKAASQAVAEYKASLNVQYTPEQIGQRGPDDFNFNPLIPEKIL